MKILANLFNKLRPRFEEGGKFSRLYPIFQMLDNFFFLADLKTSTAPYGRDPLLALFPAFLASLYFFGWRVILLLIVSYVAGGVVEILFAVIRKEEINEGFLVTGFIFPLILPPGLPLWMVAVGIIFGVVIGKEVFGGTGRNLFNAALVGRVFLALGYPSTMTSSWIEPVAQGWGRLAMRFSIAAPDAVTTATPLVMAKGGGLAPLSKLFIGNVLGSAGETSAIAILIGGIFLVIVGIANWRTILGILISFVALNAILYNFLPDQVNPVLFSLFSGGLLFGTFFMATDPVTGPITQRGKLAYGILIGLTTLLIRSFSGFVEGVMFAILFGNICAPLIDEVVIRSKIRRYAGEK
jgi:Na(+)-translocating NADH:ubiquinone oxidoreductase B subunit